MSFGKDEFPYVVVYQYVYWDQEKQGMVKSDRRRAVPRALIGNDGFLARETV